VYTECGCPLELLRADRPYTHHGHPTCPHGGRRWPPITDCALSVMGGMWRRMAGKAITPTVSVPFSRLLPTGMGTDKNSEDFITMGPPPKHLPGRDGRLVRATGYFSDDAWKKVRRI